MHGSDEFRMKNDTIFFFFFTIITGIHFLIVNFFQFQVIYNCYILFIGDETVK